MHCIRATLRHALDLASARTLRAAGECPQALVTARELTAGFGAEASDGGVVLTRYSSPEVVQVRHGFRDRHILKAGSIAFENERQRYDDE
jgi:hypothetical protein